MSIFKPVAEQLISHLNNGGSADLPQLQSFLALESRALFNWLKENPTDTEALEKLKNNIAQKLEEDKSFQDKVDEILNPKVPEAVESTKFAFAGTGAITDKGDIHIKGKYAAGRDVNVSNIFSAKKLIFSSFVILAIVLGFLLRGEISDFFEGTLSFASDDPTFKILLLPFKADQDIKEIEINYKDQLIERLKQKQEIEGLGVNLLNIDKGIEVPHTDEDARKIGEAKNADLVIWGNYEETRGETGNLFRLRYVILRDFDLDQSKKKGDTDMQELKSPSQLRKGYLQEDIDYILHWVEGINAFREQNYKTAYQHFEFINKNFSQEEYQTETYHRLGAISNKLAEYDKALTYLEKADTLIQKTFHANHPKVATNYCAIGDVYEGKGDLKTALSYYEKALKIREKNLEPDDKELADSYFHLAKLLMKTAKYQESIEYYEKSLNILNKNFEENKPHIANTHYGLGWCYYLTRQIDKALQNHKKALKLRDEIFDKEALQLADSNNGLAAIYTGLHEYKKDSFKIDETQIDTTKWEAYKKECHEQSLKYRREAVQIYQKTYDERHPNLATAFNGLGINFKLVEQYDSSIIYFKKALNIFETVYDKPHPQLGYSYRSVASALVKMEQYEEALEYLQKSLENNLVVFGQEHSIHGYVYHEMGQAYFDLKLYKQALNNVEKAKEIWKKYDLPEIEKSVELENEIKIAMS
jgi:tetratricopeptide (TPR) repeat protein